MSKGDVIPLRGLVKCDLNCLNLNLDQMNWV